MNKKLETYIKNNKLNYSKFGKIIGISRDRVRKYCKTNMIPRAKTMLTIKKVTNNEVMPESFYELHKETEE